MEGGLGTGSKRACERVFIRFFRGRTWERMKEKDRDTEKHAGRGMREEGSFFTARYGTGSRIAPELVEALRRGDTAAFETLYTHMGGPLEDFLNHILYSRDEARELAQEVFLGVWKNRRKFDSGGNIKGYMYVMARNLALKTLRRRRMEKKYLEMALPDYNGGYLFADSLVAAREAELLLRVALDGLPEKKRRVFEMSRYEKRSVDDIARELGLKRGTVQVYLSAVLKDLAEITLLLAFFLK